MERVLGVGGVFIRAADTPGLARWYRENLGIETNDEWFGAMLPLTHPDDAPTAHLVWSAYGSDSENFGSPAPPFVINYRVKDLKPMLAQLRANGCNVDDREEYSPYGNFGWVTDPEGNRIELWQPPDTIPEA
ncbi:MAG: VOC family protein [Acidimicrobiia bacterium]